MARCIAHRGPDDTGEWVDERAGLTVGFRRLAIVDLSPAGHQPMHSASGRFVVVYNGEVYNYEEIRRELVAEGAAPAFRGHSDTEVMLAAFEAWGVAGAVQRFLGMFAIALWDRAEQRLHLIRDRVGVKPLYLARFGENIIFGSELKALRAHPEFRAEIDRDALAAYFQFGCVPAPHTIYRGVQKVLPGTVVSITPQGEMKTTTYWSAAAAASRGVENRFDGSDLEATDALDALLRDAVALRMIADVPLGVFLSGGVDSSLVTALMQAQSSAPVKTFSIGFVETGYDEAPHAAVIARHLGTLHTELYVTPEEAMAVIPKLPHMYDEPFADSSQIPTYLVSALARESVTVSLSGDGGDELFGGYYRYFTGRRVWSLIRRIPRPLRSLAGRSLSVMATPRWNGVFDRWMPRGLRQNRAAERLQKLARILPSADQDAMYFALVSQWRSVVLHAGTPELPLDDRSRWPVLTDPVERMMFFDQVSYLPDDILTKVDRASMAVSLEAREPLLDHRLLEFAWRLPLGMKIRGGQGKWLLRQVLNRYIPQELMERPKMGFGVPVGAWLRGPLRDWAESLLSKERLTKEGFLDVDAVHAAWEAHLAGRGDWQHHIWTVLMFQAWSETSLRDRPVS